MAAPVMTEIDALSAKARRQAADLNRTLDELAKLGVAANVGPPPTMFSITTPRVRLTLTDPPHRAATQAEPL